MSDDARDAVDLRPTASMAAEARRGLGWRREFGRGGTAVGIARARDIANRTNLSASTVKRMVSYFARHAVDKKATGWSPGEEGYPSNGRIAWALWGGDPGESWAGVKSKQLDKSTRDDNTLAVVKVTPPPHATRGGGTRMSDLTAGEDLGFRAAKPPRLNLVRDVDFTITEARAEADGLNFEGYAAVWDRWTLINSWEGRFRERLRKGAFKKTIREARAAGRWPVMQFDHGRDPAIGALPIGVYTQMEEDDLGVHVVGRLHRSAHFEPVREAIASGAVRGMSFRFTIPDGKERWEVNADDDIDERTILEVNCMEAGPVTFPAYVETQAAVRSRHVIYLARAIDELRALGVSSEQLRERLGIIPEADEPVDSDGHSDDIDEEDSGDADVTSEELDEIIASLPEAEVDDPPVAPASATGEDDSTDADTSTNESDDEPVDGAPPVDDEQLGASHSDESSDPDTTPSDEAPAQSVPEEPAEAPRDKRADDALFRGFDFWGYRAGDL